MEIIFDQAVNIVVVPEVSRTVTGVTIEHVTDYSADKLVIAELSGIGFVTLWEGAAYDAIGQWTDTDVSNRIKELYNG